MMEIRDLNSMNGETVTGRQNNRSQLKSLILLSLKNKYLNIFLFSDHPAAFVMACSD